MNRIFSNSVWLFISRVLTVVINLLIMVMLARTYGEARFGELSFFLAYLAIASVISTFGMDVFVVRTIAGDKPNTLSTSILSALLIQLVLSMVVFIPSVFWSLFFDGPIQELSAFWLYLILLIPTAFGTVLNSILKGIEKMKLFAICLLVDIVVQAVFIYFFVSADSSLMTWVLIVLVSKIITVLLAGYFVWTRTSIRFDFELPKWKKLFQIARIGIYIFGDYT